MMIKRFKSPFILASITLVLTACGPWVVQTQPKEQVALKAPAYKGVLGKSLNDQKVADFMINNNCSGVNQFQLCKEIGLALWITSDQVVETVYLYLNNTDGFVPYKGELPHGLKYYDIMEAVEYKLKRQGIGNAGLPDEGGSPDHLHYWATYKQVGMTIIYNSPSPEDEDATIYAILVSK
jgi:hypothetical protein